MELMTRLRDERGSLSAAMPALFIAVLLVVGLIVDGGTKATAVATAQSACQQAARAAGQHIVLSAGRPSANREAAFSAGQSVLAASGVQGSLRIDGTRLSCDATKTKPTVFLNLIGISSVTGHGSANANLTTGVQEGNR
ncbi:MAG: pilus assembly protein TadE [Propionibacteriaceae bacterium]|nr:pilus assembly protein TadE [Propionibacteriaceae bacterium]